MELYPPLFLFLVGIVWAIPNFPILHFFQIVERPVPCPFLGVFRSTAHRTPHTSVRTLRLLEGMSAATFCAPLARVSLRD